MNCDLVIRNGRVYDGMGNPPVPADVAVRHARIESVGDGAGISARVSLDADGCIVTPGWIDLHTHSDRPFREQAAARAATNKLRQGVTTLVSGNCGTGTHETAAYFENLQASGVGVNVAHLAGHGSLREAVIGKEHRPARASELTAMRDRLRRALDEGAAGMSSGLIYAVSAYGDTAELIHLAHELADYDRLYASHIRGECETLFDAVDEVIRIGRETGARVHISHIKCQGPPVWKQAPAVCRRIEAARAEGIRITADQYPYPASSTSLNATITPLWAGRNIAEILASPENAQRLARDVETLMMDKGGPQTLMLLAMKDRPEWEGWRLNEIAEHIGRTPVDTALMLLRDHDPRVIAFSMIEEDIKEFMTRPYVATASDGSAQPADATGVIHPRSYGTFARKLARYARDAGVLTIERAVRAATRLPADILGLPDRGAIQPGCAADLVVIDLKAFEDHADFTDPRRCATGVRYTLVNGQIAVEHDRFTGVRSGQTIVFQKS